MKKRTPHFALALALIIGSFLMTQSTIIPNVSAESQSANIFDSIRSLFSRDRESKNKTREIDPWKMTSSEILSLPLPESGILHTFDVPVKFDTSVVGINEKGEHLFDSPIIPYEGVTPLWYQDVTGDERDAWGYPRATSEFDRIFARKNGREVVLASDSQKKNNLINKAEAYEEDPDINGLVHCRDSGDETGYFKAWFDDVAYGEGENFDDEEFGLVRRQEACLVLQEIAEMINLGDTNTTPNILFPKEQYSDLPGYVLGAASPFFYPYVSYPDNGSLYQHILSGQNPQFGYQAFGFTTDTEYAYFDARVFINFSDFDWDVDYGGVLNEDRFDLRSVLFHEIVHTLGFSSRPSYDIHGYNSGQPKEHNSFYDRLFTDDTLNTPFLVEGGLIGLISSNSDESNEVVYHPDNLVTLPDLPIYSPTSWQPGSSMSHVDKNRATEMFGVETSYVMHPSLGAGIEIPNFHDHEKGILCDLGYSIDGYDPFCDSSAGFANIDMLENYPTDTTTLCANPLENDSIYAGEGELVLNSAGVVVNTNGDVEVTYFSGEDCTGTSSTSPEDSKSIQLEYSSLDDYIYTRMYYTNKVVETNKVSNTASIIVSNCGDSAQSFGFFDYICNGSFEITVDPDGSEESVTVADGAVHGWDDIGWHNEDTPSKLKVAWTEYEEFAADNGFDVEDCSYGAPCNFMTAISDIEVNPVHGDRYVFSELARINDDPLSASFPILKTKLKEDFSCHNSCFFHLVVTPNDQDAFTENLEHNISAVRMDTDIELGDFSNPQSLYQTFVDNSSTFNTYFKSFHYTDSDSDDYVDVCILADACDISEPAEWMGWTKFGLQGDYLYFLAADFNLDDNILDGLASFGLEKVSARRFYNIPYLPAPSSGTEFNPESFGLVGRVFYDTNQNGSYNNGEYWLPNRNLNLYSETDGYLNINQSTTTDINGYYGFNVANTTPVAILLEHDGSEIITTPGVQGFYVEGEDQFHSLVPIPNIQQLGLNIGIVFEEEVLGCTDPEALNYNEDANIDDGSCYFEIEGCTDIEADNYNPDATVDDGSCFFLVYGCSDPEATNYDPLVNVDDGSCEYVGTGEILGTVYFDQNFNFDFDNEDVTMSFGMVSLFESGDLDNAISEYEITFGGEYQFTELSAGTYYLTYAPTNGIVVVEPVEGEVEVDETYFAHEVVLQNELSYPERDFGLIKEDTYNSLGDVLVDKTWADNLYSALDPYVTYRIMVTNMGDETISDIVIQDVLPTQLIFQNSYATIQGVAYNPSTGIIFIDNDLEPGQTAYIYIEVKIEKKACGLKVNTATLQSFDGFDSDSTNNSGSASLQLQSCSPHQVPHEEDSLGGI